MFGRLKTCALLALLLAACQSQQHQKPQSSKAKNNKPVPTYIGTIHQVYPEHQFALVRLARMVPKPGTTLISHPPDSKTTRMANLCVSNEQIKNSVSQMVAADIRSGTAVRGDAVYIYRNITPNTSKTQEGDEDIFSDDLMEPLENILIDGGGEGQVPADSPILEEIPADTGFIDTPAPTAPNMPQSPNKDIPSYIDKIPDTIEGWD